MRKVLEMNFVQEEFTHEMIEEMVKEVRNCEVIRTIQMTDSFDGTRAHIALLHLRLIQTTTE